MLPDVAAFLILNGLASYQAIIEHFLLQNMTCHHPLPWCSFLTVLQFGRLNFKLQRKINGSDHVFFQASLHIFTDNFMKASDKLPRDFRIYKTRLESHQVNTVISRLLCHMVSLHNKVSLEFHISLHSCRHSDKLWPTSTCIKELEIEDNFSLY